MKRVVFSGVVLSAVIAIACGAAFAQEKEWVRVWPCEADGPKVVRDAGGRQHPSTGEDSNTWFNWGGAGNWKRFKVRKGVPIIIIANGDS